MREHLRWIGEIYRLNRTGVLVAAALTVAAAVAEMGSIALYYPVLAIMTGGATPGGVGARVLAPVRHVLGGEPGLLAVLTILIVLLALRAGFLYVSRIVSNRFELQFNLDLKRRFLRRFTESTWDYIIRSKSGSLLNIFSTYTTSASRGLFYLVELLIDVVSCLAYLALALYTSPVLALFIAVTGALVAPVLRRMYWGVRILVERNIAVQNTLADKFLEYLRGFKTFKSMSREAFYVRELGRDLEIFTGNERGSYRIQAALQALGEPMFAVIGAVFLLVAHYAFAVGMETIVIFFALLTKTYSRLNSLQANMGKLVRLAPGIKFCREFEAEAVAASETGTGRPLPGRIQLFELDNVDVVYPDGTRVFEGVSLTLNVERGLIAVVGPSGIGKSTLLDLLSGLLRPTAGVFRINGVDVREIDLRSLRARVGFVPQTPVLFDRSIAENISLREKEATDLAAVEAAARLADAHGFITRLAGGYDTVMGRAGASLSVGQVQRISIARALYQQPEILFFDEPTSALDARAASEVMAVIERIAETYPVFLVSHSREICALAHRLLMLDGRGITVVEPAAART